MSYKIILKSGIVIGRNHLRCRRVEIFHQTRQHNQQQHECQAAETIFLHLVTSAHLVRWVMPLGTRTVLLLIVLSCLMENFHSVTLAICRTSVSLPITLEDGFWFKLTWHIHRHPRLLQHYSHASAPFLPVHRMCTKLPPWYMLSVWSAQTR